MTYVKLTKEQKENLRCLADTIGINTHGNYVARRGFFYTHGCTAEKMAAGIKTVVPDAIIVDQGEVWKDFRGGASVANQSHFWVEFYIGDRPIVEANGDVRYPRAVVD